MLRFFRHIRYSFIESGRVRRYLFYSIGEIALVVIGILIALQINNWNQDRIDRHDEDRILKSVADEMNNFRWKLAMGIETYNNVVLSSDRLLVAINDTNSSTLADSIDYDLGILTSRWLFGKGNIITIYDALTGSGEFGLIRSAELRNLLTTYKKDILLLESYEDIQINYVDNHLQPILNRFYNGIEITDIHQDLLTERYRLDPAQINLSISKSKFSTDYQGMLKSREFSNVVLQHMRRTATLLPIYYRLREYTAEVDSILYSINPNWLEN
ncbi:MAG: hypothetical protein HKN76_07930 [Saprospiraceae bacterium]|nr:hypothetical protein [Saprospiraceae bacterium]